MTRNQFQIFISFRISKTKYAQQRPVISVRKLREMFAKFEDPIGHSSTARDLKLTHHEQIYAKDVNISHELVSPQRDSVPIPYDRRSLILSPDNSRLVVASDVLAFAGSPIAACHATGVVSLPFSVGRSWGDLRAMFNAALNAAVKVLDTSINEQEVQAAFDHNPSALIAAGIVSVLLRQNKAWHNGGYITRDVLGIAYTAFVDMLPPNMFNKSDAIAHDASVHAARTLLLAVRLADAGGHTRIQPRLRSLTTFFLRRNHKTKINSRETTTVTAATTAATATAATTATGRRGTAVVKRNNE